MTTILADTFDSLANWTASAGGMTLVAGRIGTGMQLTGTTTAHYTIPAGPLRTVGETARFSFKVSSLAANRALCTFSSVADANQVTLRVATSGALQVLGGGTTGAVLGSTPAGTVVVNTWYTAELAVHIAAPPDGVAILELDGVEMLRLTGVRTLNQGADPVLGEFKFLGTGLGSGAVAIYDDLVLTDDDPTDHTIPLPEPGDPLPPLTLSVVVVGFEHTITPGRWQSTLHTSTTTVSH